MAIVAVAGGTGRLGRTIVEAIVEKGKHKVLILARKPNPASEEELGVCIVAVDYADIQSLTKVLEENEVDTVISAIWMMPGPSGEEPREVELIRAADASKITKRMISSDWGIPHRPGHDEQYASVPRKEKAQAKLKAAQSLETTHVKTGWFMDFWGAPGVKSHFDHLAVCVDIPNEVAAIPGDGNMPVVMTHSTDIAKFVAASLDLEKWDPVLYTVGDKASMNDLLHFAEDARGKKFSVTYDSVETLKAGGATELPGHRQAYPHLPKKVIQDTVSSFALWFAEGAASYTPQKTLNDDFPEIKPLKLKGMVIQAWKKN